MFWYIVRNDFQKPDLHNFPGKRIQCVKSAALNLCWRCQQQFMTRRCLHCGIDNRENYNVAPLLIVTLSTGFTVENMAQALLDHSSSLNSQNGRQSYIYELKLARARYRIMLATTLP